MQFSVRVSGRIYCMLLFCCNGSNGTWMTREVPLSFEDNLSVKPVDNSFVHDSNYPVSLVSKKPDNKGTDRHDREPALEMMCSGFRHVTPNCCDVYVEQSQSHRTADRVTGIVKAVMQCHSHPDALLLWPA